MRAERAADLLESFIAGADAIALAEQKVADLKTQIGAERGLSTSLAFD